MITQTVNLAEYIIKNGRSASWHDLAHTFGFPNGDAARHAWSRYKKSFPDVVVPTPLATVPRSHVLNPEARLAKEQYVLEMEDKVTKFEEDLTKGTAQIEARVGQEIKTLDELVTKCNIDLTKWEITKWVQNFWNNMYQVKVYLAPKAIKNIFQENFIEFLKTYKAEQPEVPQDPCITPTNLDKALHVEGQVTDWEVCDGKPISAGGKPNGCLLINKQDFHFNKYDVNGDNNIQTRFLNCREAISRVIRKAELGYKLDTIIYVIGSDEFNSEWTGMTTKGTPQQNILDYHTGFAMICQHEASVINMLLKENREVKVVYMPGNHDEYVGWHLITWLQAHFRSIIPRGIIPLSFDVSGSYRKYYTYENSLMMFNHGDVIKPEKLAAIFPIECRNKWSAAEYQYIFTGDKHHEKTLDMDGIMFYQLTQGSNATSQWDSKRGYQAGGFLTAFVITDRYGVGDIYKEKL